MLNLFSLTIFYYFDDLDLHSRSQQRRKCQDDSSIVFVSFDPVVTKLWLVVTYEDDIIREIILLLWNAYICPREVMIARLDMIKHVYAKTLAYVV